jgi:hypothetical protein
LGLYRWHFPFFDRAESFGNSRSKGQELHRRGESTITIKISLDLFGPENPKEQFTHGD